MNGRSETCHCGHDKASHYRDAATGKAGACLTVGDCACAEYVHREAPRPAAMLRRPNHEPRRRTGPGSDNELHGCECYDCRRWRAANA